MALCHDVTDDLRDQHVAYYRDGRWMTFGEMMASMDDMLGRLMKALQDLGVRDDTLVIFTTDNGTPRASYLKVSGDGKMLRPTIASIRDGEVVPGGKGKLDDTGTRVPLIASWPGRIAAGSRSDALVEMTDLLPTLAEVGGVETQDVTRDGISFAPILFGQQRSVEREWIYLDHRGKRGVRSRNWKLYANGRFYDLRSDAGEKQPLKLGGLSQQGADQHAMLNRVLDELAGR